MPHVHSFKPKKQQALFVDNLGRASMPIPVTYHATEIEGDMVTYRLKLDWPEGADLGFHFKDHPTIADVGWNFAMDAFVVTWKDGSFNYFDAENLQELERDHILEGIYGGLYD